MHQKNIFMLMLQYPHFPRFSYILVFLWFSLGFLDFIQTSLLLFLPGFRFASNAPKIETIGSLSWKLIFSFYMSAVLFVVSRFDLEVFKLSQLLQCVTDMFYFKSLFCAQGWRFYSFINNWILLIGSPETVTNLNATTLFSIKV